MICDGQLLQVPHDIEGILLLNISSYMGGANLWASGRPLPSSSLPDDATQSHADGRLEVCCHQISSLETLKPFTTPLLHLYCTFTGFLEISRMEEASMHV